MLSDQKYDRHRHYHYQPEQGGFGLLITDHDAGAGVESRTEGGGGHDKLLYPDRQVEKLIVIQQDIRAEEIVPIRDEIEERQQAQQWSGERQGNMPEQLHFRTTVYPCRVEQVWRQAGGEIDIGQVCAEWEKG